LPDFITIEQLNIQGLADYHVHCDYSIDASGKIGEYCNAALARGLVEICFTTHYDSNPESDGNSNFIRINGKNEPATPDNLDPYVEAVIEAREQYLPVGLSVKLGLEFGWYPGCEKEAEKIRGRFDFDHFLCGIHELDSLCFCCKGEFKKCFDRYSVDEAVSKYTDDIVAAASSGLFNAIAHLDYIRKYGLGYYGDKLDETLLRVAEERIFPALNNSGTPLEVNTSAMRRGLGDYFPRIKLINAARRAGVDVKFLGSDAHSPEQIGFDFDAAAPLASLSTVGCGLD
jgi:histidinol-phosphatase (PHP family)